METSVQRTRSFGFIPADHGDYTQGDDGCAFRKALVAGRLGGITSITAEESRVLKSKLDIPHTRLMLIEILKAFY